MWEKRMSVSVCTSVYVGIAALRYLEVLEILHRLLGVDSHASPQLRLAEPLSELTEREEEEEPEMVKKSI